jgi:hypothetical protein
LLPWRREHLAGLRPSGSRWGYQRQSAGSARWCANRSAVVLLLPQVVIERMARLTLWRYGLLASMLVRSMPYKFNESRRHKIPKAKYRVTN